jgi:spore germination cell wall hydrolase CwlJ-like protein
LSRNQWRQAMKLISNVFTRFIIAALAVMAFPGKPKQQTARDLSEDDLCCMVQNVYFETRGKDALGQAVVAHVTLNRVRLPGHPDTVCSVVRQKGQFAWTEDGKSDRMTELDAIGKVVDVALAASRRQIKDSTGRALPYYAHDNVKPHWSSPGYRLRVGGTRLGGRWEGDCAGSAAGNHRTSSAADA